jgi:Tol biopolymer transport system component
MSIRYEDRNTKTPVRLELTPPVEDVQFSTDGLWVAFEGVVELDNYDIFFATISGGDLIRLTNDPADEFDPAWRPIK